MVKNRFRRIDFIIILLTNFKLILIIKGDALLYNYKVIRNYKYSIKMSSHQQRKLQ